MSHILILHSIKKIPFPRLLFINTCNQMMDALWKYKLSLGYTPIKAEITKRKWCWASIMSLLIVVGAAVVIADHYYNHAYRWYNTNLPSPEEVSMWSEWKKYNTLFLLSRWDGFKSGDQFTQLVQFQIEPLGLNTSRQFHFLEVGMGVGAFSRIMLHMFPHSTGVGLDWAPAAIEIAKVVLPADRMTSMVCDMKKIDSGGSKFHAVFVPGALCLLLSMDQVRIVVDELHRVTKPGGGICISLMPSATSDTGTCSVRIPKDYWTNEVSYKYGSNILTIEDMDNWNLPESMGRYHMCMRKPDH